MAEALAERAALAAALNFWAPCAALTEEETCSDPGVIPANRIFLLGGCPEYYVGWLLCGRIPGWKGCVASIRCTLFS